MVQLLKITLANIELYLLPEKAIYIPSKSYLLVADLHIGKAGHFRKHGIALPTIKHEQDIALLQHLIDTWQPKQVFILGDLFHSTINKEWELLAIFFTTNALQKFALVLGNHDVSTATMYNFKNLEVVDEYTEDNLLFTHEPVENIADTLNICGHIHPGYILYGKAKQSVKLPCFYYLNNCMVLPAFGSLTGLYTMPKRKHASVYLVAQNRVVAVPPNL